MNNSKTSILKSFNEIPHRFRHIFAKYENFNAAQSKIFDDVFHTDHPIVVSAPTGSGKTVVLELAIIRLLGHITALGAFPYKIVYVAPIKALCSERFLDWQTKFQPLGLSCVLATGDSDIADFTELESAHIILTTPEKFDSLSRRWKDNVQIVAAIKLFLIDEVHLLNEDVRGPILEVIVTRMKTIQFALNSKVTKRPEGDKNLRFIAVSATIPNIEDLAVWIGDNGKNMAKYYRISENLRPVKLDKYILGYPANNCFGFKFDMSLNYKLGTVIRQYSHGKSTLIFCSSRKSVEMASQVLLNDFRMTFDDSHKVSLRMLAQKINDVKLQSLILKGMAYHHAGLSFDVRLLIEDAFRKNIIVILISTNTLAMGVNLPAHLVIVKSTETYFRGTISEYSQSAILQMIGRAGRPQYDVSGVAVIMTQEKNVKKFNNLTNGCTIVESHLHKHLAEHLNSEIVLQTITDIELAMEWIRSTFLYVRAVRCPANYGIVAKGMSRDAVEKKLEEICLAQIGTLESCGLVMQNRTNSLMIKSTAHGKLMAKFYVSLETIKIFRKINGDENFHQVFNILVQSKEFSEFTIRVNDKKALNELNDMPIRYPIKGKIKTVENKISCLLQSTLGNLPVNDSSLTQETYRMLRIAERLSKCLQEYIRLSEQLKNGRIFKALLHASIIAKCLRAKLWENSDYVCKQLKKIGSVYANMLVSAGKTTVKSLFETDPRTLEMILNKAPPFGNEIHEAVSTFPVYKLQIQLQDASNMNVIIRQVNEHHKFNGSSSIIVIGDTDNYLMFYHDRVDYIISENGVFDRTIRIKNSKTNKIHARLIHESLVGVDESVSIVLNPVEETFQVQAAKKNTRPKIQTKLKVERQIKRKATLSTKKTTDNSNDYINLLDDDEFIENIPINDLVNNQKVTSICGKDKRSCKQIGGAKAIASITRNPICLDFGGKIETAQSHNIEKSKKTDSCHIDEYIRLLNDDNFIETISLLEDDATVKPFVAYEKRDKVLCSTNEASKQLNAKRKLAHFEYLPNPKVVRIQNFNENTSSHCFEEEIHGEATHKGGCSAMYKELDIPPEMYDKEDENVMNQQCDDEDAESVGRSDFEEQIDKIHQPKNSERNEKTESLRNHTFEMAVAKGQNDPFDNQNYYEQELSQIDWENDIVELDCQTGQENETEKSMSTCSVGFSRVRKLPATKCVSESTEIPWDDSKRQKLRGTSSAATNTTIRPIAMVPPTQIPLDLSRSRNDIHSQISSKNKNSSEKTSIINDLSEDLPLDLHLGVRYPENKHYERPVSISNSTKSTQQFCRNIFSTLQLADEKIEKNFHNRIDSNRSGQLFTPLTESFRKNVMGGQRTSNPDGPIKDFPCEKILLQEFSDYPNLPTTNPVAEPKAKYLPMVNHSKRLGIIHHNHVNKGLKMFPNNVFGPNNSKAENNSFFSDMQNSALGQKPQPINISKANDNIENLSERYLPKAKGFSPTKLLPKFQFTVKVDRRNTENMRKLITIENSVPESSECFNLFDANNRSKGIKTIQTLKRNLDTSENSTKILLSKFKHFRKTEFGAILKILCDNPNKNTKKFKRPEKIHESENENYLDDISYQENNISAQDFLKENSEDRKYTYTKCVLGKSDLNRRLPGVFRIRNLPERRTNSNIKNSNVKVDSNMKNFEQYTWKESNDRIDRILKNIRQDFVPTSELFLGKQTTTHSSGPHKAYTMPRNKPESVISTEEQLRKRMLENFKGKLLGTAWEKDRELFKTFITLQLADVSSFSKPTPEFSYANFFDTNEEFLDNSISFNDMDICNDDFDFQINQMFPPSLPCSIESMRVCEPTGFGSIFSQQIQMENEIRELIETIASFCERPEYSDEAKKSLRTYEKLFKFMISFMITSDFLLSVTSAGRKI